MAAFIAIFILMDSCGGKDVSMENRNVELDSAYTMRTLKVDMLVSDSGIVRYRLISPEWLIYDNQHRRQWVFPRGLRLETYDSIKAGSTLIVADSAIQHLNTETWELMGNVRATGFKGELLCTPHLHWERQGHKLFSNDTTYFRQENGTALRGNRFRAKDDLSDYVIYRTSGDLKVQENQPEPSHLYGVRRLDSTRREVDSLPDDRGQQITKE